jgi:hypothetical protein
VNSKFELTVSDEIVMEYEEIISQKYSKATANAFISLLSELPNVKLVNPFYKWQLIQCCS